MRPIDLRDLIVGLIIVIFFAIVMGQYGKLEAFARRQVEHVVMSH